MKKIILLAVLLASCSTNSGVIPDGKDAYIVMVSGGRGFASAGELKIDAYKEAQEFCRKQDKQLETISDKTVQAGVLSSTSEAELKFKCIAK
jgi:hypothetical protein